jgi:NAD-dependent deacetylase
MEFSDKLLTACDPSRKIVVVTGAGISAESGIPTFRGDEGLWKTYRAEELATPWAFQKDPKLVWEWYDWRRGIIARAQPNAGHLAIAEMESFFPSFVLITQNVDGLHRKAGSTAMIEIHGNLWRLRCVNDGRVHDDYRVPMPDMPPRCECGGLLRPDVVWFGESLNPSDLTRAYEMVDSCDVLFVVGTSAVVQPVAGFPRFAKKHGACLVEINTAPTSLSSIVDWSLQGSAGIILPALMNKLRAKWAMQVA